MKMNFARRSLCRGPFFAFIGAAVLAAVALAAAPKISLASDSVGALLARTVAKPPASPPSVLTSDKGKLRILVNGQDVGKEDFDIAPGGGGWVAHGTTEIQSAQGAMHVTGTLTLHDDGTPVRYEWSTSGPKKASSTIEFNGASASVDLRLQGARPYTQQFTFTSPRVVILDNNLYYQYSILAHLYDWSQKGTQSFSVLVPQEMTPGTVTVQSVGKQDVNGKKLDELVVKTEDIELDLYLDNLRLMRIVVPSSNAEILRQ
ncbi:MAG: hypothetical protein ACRD4S_10630 [Candidatus Acidiferrales bacterium]